MKTIYYEDFSDDFVQTKKQSKSVPENYQFIKKNPIYNFTGAFLFIILKIVAKIYAIFWLHLKIVGKEKLKHYQKTTPKNHRGYYIFANHTLSLGDVFNPALYSSAKPYYVCSSSNLGIPILGPILPLVGALPIPESLRAKKRLFDAISLRAKQGNAIIIYPEAHLWPFYTKIRPFKNTAFNFPVRDNLPIFTATTTFQKKHITIYIDGPFFPDNSLEKKARLEKLHDQIMHELTSRAQLSTYEKIKYQKKEP